MNTLFNETLSEAERYVLLGCAPNHHLSTRVDSLEPFDEEEQFYLKCHHYFVAVATNGPTLKDFSESTGACWPQYDLPVQISGARSTFEIHCARLEDSDLDGALKRSALSIFVVLIVE